MSGALKLTLLPFSAAVISDPADILYVNSSPSTSLPTKLTLPVKSSSNTTLGIELKTGASFTEFTVKLTDALSDKAPSLAVKVKLSEPL